MAVGKMNRRNDKSFESKNITSLRLSETIGLEFKGFPGIDCIPYPNRKKDRITPTIKLNFNITL